VRRPRFDSGAPHRDLARPLHGEKLPTSPFSSLIIRFEQTNLHFDQNSLFYAKPDLLKPATSWETDRIAAMAHGLRTVGATVEEGDDYLVVTPPSRLTSHAVIDTYDDHRVAMCFSLVSLGDVAIRINNPECTGKTFPEYFDYFARVAKAF